MSSLVNSFSWAEFLTLTGGYLFAIISPGPDFAIVTRNSLMYSTRVGVLTALGIALGLLFHATYTLIGIALLLKNYPMLYNGLKLVGAGYLIYLGVSTFRQKVDLTKTLAVRHATSGQSISSLTALRTGFLTNALNPIAMSFYLGLLAASVRGDIPVSLKCFYAAEFFILGWLWFGCLALVLSQPKVRQFFAQLGSWFGRITGGVLVSLGLKLVFISNP